VVAAVVWNFGLQKPWAQMSLRTGLIVQGDSLREQVVNTDGTWKVLQDEAYSPAAVAPRPINQFMVVGPGDRIDGSAYPWGWQESDFDDARWLQSQVNRQRNSVWRGNRRRLVAGTTEYSAHGGGSSADLGGEEDPGH